MSSGVVAVCFSFLATSYGTVFHSSLDNVGLLSSSSSLLGFSGRSGGNAASSAAVQLRSTSLCEASGVEIISV